MNQSPGPEYPSSNTAEPTPPSSQKSRKKLSLPKNRLVLALLSIVSLTALMSLGYITTSYLYNSDTTKESDQSTSSTSDQPAQPDRVTDEIIDKSPQPDNPADTPAPSEPQPSSPIPKPPYTKNALVIKYFPLTADKKYLNSAITGDVSASYSEIRQKTNTLTSNLITSINRSTTYQGYKQSAATPSIDVKIYKTFEHNKAFPYINNKFYPKHPIYKTPEPRYEMDYQKILTEHAICTHVTKNNISQVFIWAYSGYGSSTGEIRAWESNMSGPYGNISNSYQENNMPNCGKTYVVYVFNYGRGTAEALHSWGHQIEREMTAVNPGLFMAFRGPEAAGLGKTGIARCGSVHHPPNSTKDYDYANVKAYSSDCLSGSLDSTGKTSLISCKVWGCEDISDTNNPHLNYQIWLWQNLPGYDNISRFQGKPVSNMWLTHADFDAAMSAKAKNL